MTDFVANRLFWLSVYFVVHTGDVIIISLNSFGVTVVVQDVDCAREGVSTFVTVIFVQSNESKFTQSQKFTVIFIVVFKSWNESGVTETVGWWSLFKTTQHQFSYLYQSRSEQSGVLAGFFGSWQSGIQHQAQSGTNHESSHDQAEFCGSFSPSEQSGGRQHQLFVSGVYQGAQSQSVLGSLPGEHVGLHDVLFTINCVWPQNFQSIQVIQLGEILTNFVCIWKTNVSLL